MNALGSSFADIWRLICASGVIAKALHPRVLRCDTVDFHPLLPHGASSSRGLVAA